MSNYQQLTFPPVDIIHIRGVGICTALQFPTCHTSVNGFQTIVLYRNLYIRSYIAFIISLYDVSF